MISMGLSVHSPYECQVHAPGAYSDPKSSAISTHLYQMFCPYIVSKSALLTKCPDTDHKCIPNVYSLDIFIMSCMLIKQGLIKGSKDW